MITHDMRLVCEYADSLLVLSAGRVVYEGGPADFFARPGLVEESGLSMPVLGRVSGALRDPAGLPGDVLTVRDFLAAAGPGPAAQGPPGPAAQGGG
jgi:energy-coupling factor transport system ATP-binding protein